MEVPYHASGASFREQYALASALSSATNIDAEARKSIRQTLTRLSTARLSPHEVKECLLLLMQAELALIHKDVSLEPALGHAIKLAEGGLTLADRRVGYLFLQEHMRPNNPAALLLVNTIRKDLESNNDSRIILALSALIHLPNEDVVPAVRDPLKRLYLHHSVAIQRLALAAATSLAKIDTSVLEDLLSAAPDVIRGDEPMVLSALVDALNVALEVSPDDALSMVAQLVVQMWDARTNDNPTAAATLVLKLVKTSGAVLSRSNPPAQERLHSHLLRVLADYTTRLDVRSKVLVLQFCRHAKSSLNEAAQLMVLKPIRSILAEYAPSSNDVYWALTCLELLPSELWSNTLDEAEVRILVTALNADDESTRRAALRLFKNADRQTLKVHFESLSEGPQSDRAMEAAAIMEDTGEGYAKRLRQVLSRREKGEKRQRKKSGERMETLGVMQDVVGIVLTTLRDRGDPYRSAFTEAILRSMQKHTHGPTLVLIAAAITCEYADETLIPPEEIVQTLSSCLPDTTAAIQEALLIAMLRAGASCDEMPPACVEAVEAVKSTAGRHIRRVSAGISRRDFFDGVQRCEQFDALVRDRPTLRRLTQSPSSRTLPGFLAHVETHFLPTKSPPLPPVQLPSSPGGTARALRYTAYASPSQPTDRFKRSKSSSSTRSRLSESNERDHNPLERTVTPGELALMMQNAHLRTPPRSPGMVPQYTLSPSSPSTSYQSDLIGLESPSRPSPWMEPIESGPNAWEATAPEAPTSSEAFDDLWREIGDAKEHVQRGWCGDAPDEVVERLRTKGFDIIAWPSDSGAIRVFVCEQHAVAVLLCRDGDDGSCLWILKSSDARLRTSLRDVLHSSG
ncbi:ARM repeat-containing protein [Calocera cornea HHB12733]|uniref:ARM repeat-containing protein n=1 Tax=Calocera cornea HHB12733 TaxID=1353952 RepID=A0A165E2Q9_9BASI|nr:ARM repeat-containing protein [Calocera cornea HHB12733]